MYLEGLRAGPACEILRYLQGCCIWKAWSPAAKKHDKIQAVGITEANQHNQIYVFGRFRVRGIDLRHPHHLGRPPRPGFGHLEMFRISDSPVTVLSRSNNGSDSPSTEINEEIHRGPRDLGVLGLASG